MSGGPTPPSPHLPKAPAVVSTLAKRSDSEASAPSMQRSQGRLAKVDWRECVGSTVLGLERTPSFFQKIENDSALDYNLPKQGAVAGQILSHARLVIEKLVKNQWPLIWKVGYSHDPEFRFRNRIYGYSGDRECWQAMLVVYVSHETVGPAFLEAALINTFQGSLVHGDFK